MAEKIDLSKIEVHMIDVFIQSVQLIGLPKSLGAIYGLLFVSPEPLTRDTIMLRLNISLGSASMGLKQLRAFKAVRSVFVPGDRKDYFIAETEFRKLIAGYMNEEVFPHLEMVKERLAQIEESIETDHNVETDHVKMRLDKLSHWMETGADSLKGIIQLIK